MDNDVDRQEARCFREKTKWHPFIAIIISLFALVISWFSYNLIKEEYIGETKLYLGLEFDEKKARGKFVSLNDRIIFLKGYAYFPSAFKDLPNEIEVRGNFHDINTYWLAKGANEYVESELKPYLSRILTIVNPLYIPVIIESKYIAKGYSRDSTDLYWLEYRVNAVQGGFNSSELKGIYWRDFLEEDVDKKRLLDQEWDRIKKENLVSVKVNGNLIDIQK
ncbi:MAG: hypothetical protein OEV42_16785 [Deltaproteobacteria bacterium]|nr:hypothetical protein [Deltaproteobacteria bacterium]